MSLGIREVSCIPGVIHTALERFVPRDVVCEREDVVVDCRDTLFTVCSFQKLGLFASKSMTQGKRRQDPYFLQTFPPPHTSPGYLKDVPRTLYEHARIG